LLGQPLVLDRAAITSDNTLHLVLQLPTPAIVNISLTDILGRTVWNGELNCTAGTTDRELALPQNLPTGPLMLRAQDGQNIRSREVLLVK
jgi:hypothetical protein